MSRAAVEPKRARGRLRVSAILETGAAIFAEKGYDAATMTEIATRSGTAIGSLYRFFPTKNALAEALVEVYGEALFAALDEIEEEALAGRALADALVDIMIERRSSRAAAMTLFGARSDLASRRLEIRTGTRRRMAAIFARLYPGMTAKRIRTRGVMLLSILKQVPALVEEADAEELGLIDEARRVVLAYLTEEG